MPRERIASPQFLLCFAAHGLQAIAFNLFLPLPKYLFQLGANDALIGTMMSLTGLAAVAVRPPLGRAMNRSGRRGVILVGGVLHVLATTAYLSVDRVGALLAGVRLLHGVAEAMLFSALFTFAADYVPAARRTQGLALFGVSGMLPIAVGAGLGDRISQQYGWPWLFVTATAVALSSLALSLGLRDAPRPRVATGPEATMVATLRQRELAPIWFLGAVFAVVLTAFFIFVPRFVQDTGIGSVSLFFGCYSGAALVLRIGFGWLPDRVGAHRTLVPALLALIAGLCVMMRAQTGSHVALAGLLCGLGHGYAFPILSSLVVSRVSDEARGTALAIFTGLFDFGLLLGGRSFGTLVERAGFPTLYGFAAVLLAAALALFVRWDARVAPRRA